ncbi:hypothetical protein PVK06_026802 [Gossypium arboreum]|uniref:DUF4283 domain-containing protein n=1 Tax=Gossypium arboreum TaxID=29729 RepID=A0ABR0P147_GOSAR|nr:hypothetical protein PVK06_026802 [Gossypium arboreum]
MERGLENLNIEDGEEEAWMIVGEGDIQKPVYKFCIVGCFLITSVVHFSAMRNTMANLWHPLARVQISNLGEKRFLFKFFHEVDIDRVENGSSWTFNNDLLVIHQLKKDESVADPISDR